jgi:hypothetical protein
VPGRQLRRRDDSMSQPNIPEEDDLLPEYDFSHAVRGKHHESYRAGTNVVFLDPDIARAFKDSAQCQPGVAYASDSREGSARPDRSVRSLA